MKKICTERSGLVNNYIANILLTLPIFLSYSLSSILSYILLTLPIFLSYSLSSTLIDYMSTFYCYFYGFIIIQINNIKMQND